MAFNLYHWSPADRRNKILKYGLMPNSRSKCGEWKPPYICFSNSPIAAWNLSAALTDKLSEWDLWVVSSSKITDCRKLSSSGDYKPNEYRTRSRVFKRDIWHVGTRTHKPRKKIKKFIDT